MPFRVDIAQRVADQVAGALAPHCERIAVAGSIRRRRAQVNDVDLVVVPKLEVRRSGLFEGEEQEPLKESAFYQALGEVVSIVQGGEKLIRGFVAATLRSNNPAWELAAISCDVYIATEESWPTVLLIRTGSAAHNVWLCARARELGGMLHADGTGLELAGEYDARLQRNGPRRVVVPHYENQILELLCWGATPLPEERECDQRRRPKWLGNNSEVRTQNAEGNRR